MNIFVESSGGSYTFGTLVDSIFRIVSVATNANLYSVIEEIEPTLEATFGIEDLIKDGKIDYESILNSSVLRQFYKNVKITTDSGTIFCKRTI